MGMDVIFTHTRPSCNRCAGHRSRCPRVCTAPAQTRGPNWRWRTPPAAVPPPAEVQIHACTLRILSHAHACTHAQEQRTHSHNGRLALFGHVFWRAHSRKNVQPLFLAKVRLSRCIGNFNQILLYQVRLREFSDSTCFERIIWTNVLSNTSSFTIYSRSSGVDLLGGSTNSWGHTRIHVGSVAGAWQQARHGNKRAVAARWSLPSNSHLPPLRLHPPLLCQHDSAGLLFRLTFLRMQRCFSATAPVRHGPAFLRACKCSTSSCTLGAGGAHAAEDGACCVCLVQACMKVTHMLRF